MVDRRRVLRGLALAGTAGVAGCTGLPGGADDGTDSPSDSPGNTASPAAPSGTGSSTGTATPGSPSITGTWRRFQGDRRNAGWAATPTGPEGSPGVAWRVGMADEARGDPVVAGDTVIASGWGSTLFALATDGTERWTVEAESGSLGRPAAVADGYAFVGDDGGNVAALAVGTGEAAWTADVGGSLRGGPVLADGRLYLPVQESLVALDAESGERLWTVGADRPFAATPAVADGTVYAPSLDGHLYAVGADGERRWRVELDSGGGLPSPTVADGTVYVGWSDGVLYALDAADGSERWTRRVGGATTVALADDTLYHAGFEVGALDPATGEERWSRPTPDGTERPVTVGERSVYLAAGSTLLSLSPADGSERWRHEAGAELVSSPALVDGRLVVGTAAGELLALA